MFCPGAAGMNDAHARASSYIRDDSSCQRLELAWSGDISVREAVQGRKVGHLHRKKVTQEAPADV